jgi:transposase
MDTNMLFSIGLNLSSPWKVVKSEFRMLDDSKVRELHIWIDFDRGAKFMSSKGTVLSPHDTVDKEWRHLNFFEHPCYLHARVPRLKTDASSIEMAQVPWARSNSGFTMLFEAFAMALIEEETPVNSVAKTVKEYPNRIWTMFRHWVEKGKRNLNLSKVSRIGVDETSRRKGHSYITQFVDLDTRQTIFVCPGKDSDTFRKFSEWLMEHDSDPSMIEVVAMDMSNAFTSGCMTYFPHAHIVYDKFHLVQETNKRLDEVRKSEANEKKLLKGHRFTFLHLRKNLPEKKLQELDTLLLTYPSLGKAYGLKEGLVDILNAATSKAEGAWDDFLEWLDLAKQSALEPFKKLADTFKAHLFGIKTFFEQGQITNGVLESLNAKVQLAKRRARGYANVYNFMDMVYYINGGECFLYPHKST